MTTLYDLLDPRPDARVREALDRIAEHFEEMSARELALEHYERAGVLRDAAIFVRLQKEM